MPRLVDPNDRRANDPPRQRAAPPERAKWFRYTDAASVGIEMVVAITICALGALWLERNVTHWSPWTSIIGLLIGIAAAGKAVMRAARIKPPESPTEGANAALDGAAAARKPPSVDRAARPGDSG